MSGVESGQIYSYRVQGPSDPSRGMRFDPTKILLDPYGRGVVVPGNYSRDSTCKEGENTATGMKSVVVDPRAYDWEKDMPLNRPWSRTIIYEMHVRGFTRQYCNHRAMAGFAEADRVRPQISAPTRSQVVRAPSAGRFSLGRLETARRRAHRPARSPEPLPDGQHPVDGKQDSLPNPRQ